MLACLREHQIVSAVELGKGTVVLVARVIGFEITSDARPVADIIPVKGGFDVQHAAGFSISA